MQVDADILDASLRVTDIEEVKPRCAAFAAGFATGVWRARARLLAGWRWAVQKTLRACRLGD
jgi:glycerol kinase